MLEEIVHQKSLVKKKHIRLGHAAMPELLTTAPCRKRLEEDLD